MPEGNAAVGKCRRFFDNREVVAGMTATVKQPQVAQVARPGDKESVLFIDERNGPKVALYSFAGVPLVLAPTLLVVFIIFGLISWLNVGLAIGFYYFTILGVTVGYHRYFTHRSFKTDSRVLEFVLAAAAAMAIQGNVFQWVADHLYHHQNSDGPGDLHSPWNLVDQAVLDAIESGAEVIPDPDMPWRYGVTSRALLKGMWHAHIGWVFNHLHVQPERYVSKLMQKPHLRFMDRYFLAGVVVSLFAPMMIVFAITLSWRQTLVAAGLTIVRMWFVHHVTWTTNSLCHVLGERPNRQRGKDRSTNLWWLALVSCGENWHNNHHGDPTCARHGTKWWQIDLSWYVIWTLQKLGLVYDVRLPKLVVESSAR